MILLQPPKWHSFRSGSRVWKVPSGIKVMEMENQYLLFEFPPRVEAERIKYGVVLERRKTELQWWSRMMVLEFPRLTWRCRKPATGNMMEEFWGGRSFRGRAQRESQKRWHVRPPFVNKVVYFFQTDKGPPSCRMKPSYCNGTILILPVMDTLVNEAYRWMRRNILIANKQLRVRFERFENEMFDYSWSWRQVLRQQQIGIRTLNKDRRKGKNEVKKLGFKTNYGESSEEAGVGRTNED